MRALGAGSFGVFALVAVAGGGCGGHSARTTDDGAAPADGGPAPADGGGTEMACGVAAQLYNVDTQEKLDALVGCTRLLGSLRVGDALFTNLDQLESLRFVDGSVNLFRNESLTDIDGLRNLETVGGELRVGFHPQLIGLNGLASLRSVGALFFVVSNARLTTLAGLEQLRSVGPLRIETNSSLRTLQSLSGLQTVAGDLSILLNPMLPQAEAEAFAATVNTSGTVTVSNNGP
jgi:hypothetical protein